MGEFVNFNIVKCLVNLLIQVLSLLGNGRWKARTPSCCHSWKIQYNLEFLAGEEQSSRMLPIPGRTEKLLLL